MQANEKVNRKKRSRDEVLQNAVKQAFDSYCGVPIRRPAEQDIEQWTDPAVGRPDKWLTSRSGESQSSRLPDRGALQPSAY